MFHVREAHQSIKWSQTFYHGEKGAVKEKLTMGFQWCHSAEVQEAFKLHRCWPDISRCLVGIDILQTCFRSNILLKYFKGNPQMCIRNKAKCWVGRCHSYYPLSSSIFTSPRGLFPFSTITKGTSQSSLPRWRARSTTFLESLFVAPWNYL